MEGYPIEVGKGVNIRRTDGRVHLAMVSKLNPEERSITVDWYEKGETKSKVVELDLLIALNPELLQNRKSPEK